MPARNSRKSADVDGPKGREKALRTSGKSVAGRVKVGHDKMGRSKYRTEGALAGARDDPAATGTGSGARNKGDPYPNLTAQRELEHAQHVSRAMKMGLTRKQAEEHARSDEADGHGAGEDANVGTRSRKKASGRAARMP